MTTKILAIIAITAILLVAGCNVNLADELNDLTTSKSNEKFVKFSSQQELEDYIKATESPGFGYGGIATRGLGIAKADVAESAGAFAPTAASDDYSTTNIQVAGVDEADIVKNDGKYIYLVKNNKVIIIDAFPAENAKIISEIDPEGYVQEIFINDDKLILFGNEIEYYYPYPIPYYRGDVLPVDIGGGIGGEVVPSESAKVAEVSSGQAISPSPEASWLAANTNLDDESSQGASAEIAVASRVGIIAPDYYYKPPRSFIKVYDVSDKENPKIFRNITTEGSYYDSRMIGNYVYAIFNQPVYNYPGPIPLPVIYEGSQVKTLSATEIYHPIIPPIYNTQYTNVIALNIDNKNQEASLESFLIDYASTLFVSKDNIYIATPKQVDYRFFQLRVFEEALIPSLPQDIQNKINNIKKSDKKDYIKYTEISEIINEYMLDLSPTEREQLDRRIQDKTEELQAEFFKESQKTIIHKISIDNSNIKYEAQGEVLGHLLNQFSMDEYKDNLRLATTTNPFFFGIRRGIEAEEEVQKNHLYILDEDLNLQGKIEDIAPGERIYSARFIQDRAYLVTFKQIDPLFVIDVSNPSQPKILGKLKIPGYSDYLHPYDEDTIIGIGKETEDIKEGSGIFALPKGVKLALFDVSDVANPREIAKYDIGDRGTDSEALYEHKAFLFSREKNLLVLPITLAELKNAPENQWQYGEYTFQGAYVFELTKESGFKLKGRISHIDADELLKSGSYPYFSNPVRRSLYIGNYLYTISEGFVKANKLDNLDEIKSIKLPKIEYDYPYYPLIAGSVAPAVPEAV